MSLLRGLLAAALCLGLQAALGRVWAESHRYLDLMALPVLWYAIAGSQRTAMVVGCSAGLLQDAWFQLGTFGLNGFKKTFLGWALGGLASRFDMNHVTGRFAAGLVFSLADSVIDLGLRYMLDQQPQSSPAELALRAVTLGALATFAFGSLERWQRFRELRRFA